MYLAKFTPSLSSIGFRRRFFLRPLSLPSAWLLDGFVEFKQISMAINKSALSSTFKPSTVREKQEQAQFRKWQAVFYSLRTLVWDDAKGRVFKEALENGVLREVAPGVRLPDGSYSRPEYDQDDISEVYTEARERFNKEFDDAFVKATIEEMVDFAKAHFGYDLEMLMELNAQRSAVRFNR